MKDIKIFAEKKFWKAIMLNAAFITLLIASIWTYSTLLKISLQKLGETEFIKLNITDPAQILNYKNEILQTTPVINKIYFEWAGETILQYLAVSLLFTLFYGNTLSVLVSNRLLRKTELGRFTKFSLKFFAIAVVFITGLTLLSKVWMAPYTFAISTLAFYLLSLIMSAETIAHSAKFLDSILKGIKNLRYILTRFFVGTIALAMLCTITLYIFVSNNIIVTQIKIFGTAITVLLIIWSTWMANASMVSLKCKDTHK